MRILCLLTDAFGGHGGIALYNRDLLVALCKHPNCTEVVAIPRLQPNPSEPQPEKLTYINTGINGKLSYIKTVISTVSSKPNFDLIICGHINLVPLAMILRTCLKVPVLLEIYGIDSWQPTRSRLTNLLVRKVDFFVSISEITQQRFLSWTQIPAEKGFLLPNAIHQDEYGTGLKNQELLKRYGLEGKKILMTLGRLAFYERCKGFDEVLELLPDLAQKIPDIAYLIVGMGDDQCRLEEKAHMLGIADRVVFTGFIKESEKADHFRLADVYVMPSRGEGFGFVLLEAMACGIPVIASLLDGGREAVLNGEIGQLVDPNDLKSIESAILTALNTNVRKVPDKLEYFGFDNFTARLISITSNVLNK